MNFKTLGTLSSMIWYTAVWFSNFILLYTSFKRLNASTSPSCYEILHNKIFKKITIKIKQVIALFFTSLINSLLAYSYMKNVQFLRLKPSVYM